MSLSVPYITFEPEWIVTAGPLNLKGKGVIGNLIPVVQRPLIDSFKLLLGTHSVKVEPKSGRISFNSTIVLQLQCSAELCWSRTMEKELQAGGDRNSAAFRCLFYKLGLEQNGKKHGWRIFEDGRMIKGI